jgi:uncharacterized membrane protein (DUF485 family)
VESAVSSSHSSGGAVPPTETEQRYLAAQASPEFQALRKRFRGFVLPVAAASLAWYFLYVLLAAYAVDFMSQRVVGNITVGLILGLLQFITTFAVTAAYIRYADKHLDPATARIRAEMERKGLL